MNAFNTDAIEPMNPIKRGVLYYVIQRVVPEKSFGYYKDIYRHIEGLCSARLDGFIRQSDIKRLPKTLRPTMQVLFSRFARTVDIEEVSLGPEDSLDDSNINISMV